MKEELMSAAFRTILDEATEMIFLKDVDLVYQAVSAPSAEEVVGHTDAEIYEDKNLSRRYEADERRLLFEQKDMRGYRPGYRHTGNCQGCYEGIPRTSALSAGIQIFV